MQSIALGKPVNTNSTVC